MIVYVDEVGTGSIAGALLVCAVADTGNRPIDKLKDSKQYSRPQRDKLFNILSKNLIYSFGAANPSLIEKLNIHYAKYFGMKRAIESLSKKVNITKVIVDGKFKIPDLDFPQEPIIKADEKFYYCSAASILAKVKRDNMMSELNKVFPGYSFDSNVGYYSPAHRDGVIKNGLTSLHRKNFKYTKYCEWEYQERLKSNMSFEEYIEFVGQYKKKTGMSRYGLWLQNEKKKKWGEQEW